MQDSKQSAGRSQAGAARASEAAASLQSSLQARQTHRAILPTLPSLGHKARLAVQCAALWRIHFSLHCLWTP